MLSLRQSVATFRHTTWYKLSFIVLVYLDVVMTVVATRNGFTELNPVMAGLVATPWALALVKGAATIGIGWLVPGRLLLPSILFMLAVTTWNLRELGLGA